MILNLIKSDPSYVRTYTGSDQILRISELFANTIQGEGVNVGIPATFIRLKDCTLNCVWCDTLEVWRYGNPYGISEILKVFEDNGLIEKFRNGQHLIFTGGSPLLQQESIISFILQFVTTYDFKPYIEIENEVMLKPSDRLSVLVDCWNNSPKLDNSKMRYNVRYKPDIIRFTSGLDNSWFKFVMSSEVDWIEICDLFIETGLIDRRQIILMPEGQTRAELQKSYEAVIEVCTRESVRFSDRAHVSVWDLKTGV